MARTLDLDLLRTFVAVADRAGMTAAANALHLTQGAVSQQVKRLEVLFGAPLFERNRHGLRLTGAGERLLGKARHLLDLHDGLWADMTAVVPPEPVRLGVPHDLMGRLLTQALRAHAAACPGNELSLRCAASPDLIEALRQGKLDIALAEEPPDLATGECLRVEPLAWAGAKGGDAHHRRPLPLSLVGETCAFRPAVLAALRGQGRAWRTVFEGSAEATLATVQADLAVTAWLAFAIPPGLGIVPAGTGLPPLPPFAITLHLPTADPRSAAAGLARHIRDAFNRHPETADPGRPYPRAARGALRVE